MLADSWDVVTAPDGEGNKTTFEYWPDGNVKLQTVRDGAGNFISRTKYTYTFGALTKEEGLKEDNTVLRTTEFVNGVHGVTMRRTFRTLPPVPPAPPQVEILETTFEYDLDGRLKKTIDPDGTFTRTEYNPAGQPWKTYDKSGRVTEQLYDDMGRLVKTIYPGGSYEELTYWPEGQRKTFRDRIGYVTQYCYDAAGRLAKTRPPQPGESPDPTNLPDPPCSSGAVVENVYDPKGRLWKTIDGEGNLTEYEYTLSGRREKVYDPVNGAQTPRRFTLFQYDANGNLRFVTDPKDEMTEYQYDKANRRIKTKPPVVTGEVQREMTTGYVGRTRTETDLAGKVTTFENDELGQLIKVTDAHGKHTTYGYDEVGNRIRQTDAKGRVTRFEYDKMGRETKRILPGGDFETKTYTTDGSLDIHTDFNGHATHHEYDPVTGRLDSKEYADAAMPDVEFTYYPDGRRRRSRSAPPRPSTITTCGAG